MLDRNGYQRFSVSGKLVSQWVKEKNLGRPLRDKEVVHHKDRDKLNNNSGNLWAFKNQKQHDRTHRKDKKRTGFW